MNRMKDVNDDVPVESSKANTLPPDAVAYHFTKFPVAVKLATVPDIQKVWSLTTGKAVYWIIASGLVFPLET